MGTEYSVVPSANRVLSCQRGYFDHSESTELGLFLVKSIEGRYAIITLKITIESPRKKFMLAPMLTAVGVYSVHVYFTFPSQASPGWGSE
jgi:hypothetical protein